MDPRAKLLSMDNFAPSSTLPVDWNHSTVGNLGNANNSKWNADWQIRQSQIAHSNTQKDNIKNYQNTHNNFARKIDATSKLSAHLQHRICCTNNSINLSKQSLAALQNSMEAKIPPLQLCTFRREQRSHRPPRELVRDPCEISLEDEQNVLTDARSKLQHNCDKTDRMIGALTKSLDELEHDLQNKSHSLGIDDKCFGSQHRTWPHSGRQAAKMRTPRNGTLPPMPGAEQLDKSGPMNGTRTMGGAYDFGLNDTGRVDHGHTCANIEQEEQRHHHTMSLMNNSSDLERAAQRLREESECLMQRTQRDCEMAKNSTEDKLQRRINETKDLRNQLISNIEHTTMKIDKLSQCNGLTGLNLDSHAEPRDLYSKKNKLRSSRLPRENIGDPVKTAMDKHATQLKNNFSHLTDMHSQEVSALADLERLKQTMEDDLRDKTSSLQIELKCKNQALPEKGSNLSSVVAGAIPMSSMGFTRRMPGTPRR